MHDHYRLWYLPPALIELVRQLDYTVSLRSSADNVEVQNLLSKIESISCSLMSIHNLFTVPVTPRSTLSRRQESITGGITWGLIPALESTVPETKPMWIVHHDVL